MKNILINGLLAGVVTCILFLVFQFIDPALNFSFTVSLISTLIVYTFFLIRAGRKQKKELGGFIGFGDIFISSMAIYAIGSLIGIVFSYLMIKNNPELIELVSENAENVNRGILEMAGMSEDQIALKIEESRDVFDAEAAVSLKTNILGWVFSLPLFGIPLSVIASFILKKNKPE